MYRTVGTKHRLGVDHAIANADVGYFATDFADHASRFGAESAGQRRGRIQSAADVGIDIVDANRFVFDLDFMLGRINGRKVHSLQYVRAAVLVKFNTCCHASSRNVVIFRPNHYLGNSIHYGRK